MYVRARLSIGELTIKKKICPKCGKELEVSDLMEIFRPEIIGMYRMLGSTRATARTLSRLYGKPFEAWRTLLRKEMRAPPKLPREAAIVVEKLSRT